MVKWERTKPGEYKAFRGRLFLYHDDQAPSMQWVLVVNHTYAAFFRTLSHARTLVDQLEQLFKEEVR
jgi:hypothetical protein